MERAYLVDRLADVIAGMGTHPRGIVGLIEDGERKLGATIIPLGASEPFPFPADDWMDGVVSVLGGKARIVAIHAHEEGRGALRRLVNGIQAAGLVPVIVEPVGPTMPAILKRWGWKRHVRGSGWERVEEWSPRTSPPPPDRRAP